MTIQNDLLYTAAARYSGQPSAQGYALAPQWFDIYMFGNLSNSHLISSFADQGGGIVRVTTTLAHGFSLGNNEEQVQIEGTTNYNGTFTIYNVSVLYFDIEATWSGDDGTGRVYGSDVEGVPVRTKISRIWFNEDSTLIDSDENEYVILRMEAEVPQTHPDVRVDTTQDISELRVVSASGRVLDIFEFSSPLPYKDPDQRAIFFVEWRVRNNIANDNESVVTYAGLKIGNRVLMYNNRGGGNELYNSGLSISAGKGYDYSTIATTGMVGEITAFADAGGGEVTVTSNGHNLRDGDFVIISGTTSYNDTYEIEDVTTNTFNITETWVANDAMGRWLLLGGLEDETWREAATPRVIPNFNVVKFITKMSGRDLMEGSDEVRMTEFGLESDYPVVRGNEDGTYVDGTSSENVNYKWIEININSDGEPTTPTQTFQDADGVAATNVLQLLEIISIGAYELYPISFLEGYSKLEITPAPGLYAQKKNIGPTLSDIQSEPNIVPTKMSSEESYKTFSGRDTRYAYGRELDSRHRRSFDRKLKTIFLDRTAAENLDDAISDDMARRVGMYKAEAPFGKGSYFPNRDQFAYWVADFQIKEDVLTNDNNHFKPKCQVNIIARVTYRRPDGQTTVLPTENGNLTAIQGYLHVYGATTGDQEKDFFVSLDEDDPRGEVFTSRVKQIYTSPSGETYVQYICEFPFNEASNFDTQDFFSSNNMSTIILKSAQESWQSYMPIIEIKFCQVRLIPEYAIPYESIEDNSLFITKHVEDRDYTYTKGSNQITWITPYTTENSEGELPKYPSVITTPASASKGLYRAVYLEDTGSIQIKSVVDGSNVPGPIVTEKDDLKITMEVQFKKE